MIVTLRFARSMRAAAVVVTAALVAPPVALAKWAQPAAGSSASGQPEVVFTFDDGPHHKYTSRILDELAEHNVQGLFFWVGHRVMNNRGGRARRRAVVERAVREGHVIGTHTVNHVHLCRTPRMLAAREIDDAIDVYEMLTAMPMWLFRAPYGDQCDTLIGLLAKRGIRHLHWDMDPREWLDHDAERTAAYLIRKVRNLDQRGVILLHDTKLASVKALAIVLDWIARENRRRKKRNLLPIKILSPSELMAERLDRELWDWFGDVRDRSSKRAFLAATQLVPGRRGTTTAQLPSQR